MFDTNHSGQIDMNEFQALWNYIHQWKGVFDGFDRDRSGAIDANELNNGTVCVRVSTSVCVCVCDVLELRSTHSVIVKDLGLIIKMKAWGRRPNIKI